MTSNQTATISIPSDTNAQQELTIVRDIHPISPPAPPMFIRRSSSLSVASVNSEVTENFTTMSREFNALVVAGAALEENQEVGINNLDRIGEEEDNFNPLAIVPGINPMADSEPRGSGDGGEAAVRRVKKEEIEAKINAWENSKVAKINNRFKCEEAIIRGWEEEQLHKAASWMKKIERKLEEKRVKSQERMENKIAKARRKAEERRASAEAKRGTKVAKIIELANLMRAVGRAPIKRSFF